MLQAAEQKAQEQWDTFLACKENLVKRILQEVQACWHGALARSFLSHVYNNDVLIKSHARSADLPSQRDSQGNPEEYTAGESGRSESSASEQGAEQHDEVSSPAAGDKGQCKRERQGSDAAAEAEVGFLHWL